MLGLKGRRVFRLLVRTLGNDVETPWCSELPLGDASCLIFWTVLVVTARPETTVLVDWA